MKHQTQIEHDSCVAACISMISGVAQKELYDCMKQDKRGSGLDGELRQWVRIGYLPTVMQSTMLENPLLKGRAVLATVPSLHKPGGNHRIILDLTGDFLEVFDPSEGRPDAMVYTVDKLLSWSELTVVDYCGLPLTTAIRTEQPLVFGPASNQQSWRGYLKNSWGANWTASPSSYVAPDAVPTVNCTWVPDPITKTEAATDKAKEFNHDVDADLARTLHRVVRAMHDGHCYNCGHLGPSATFEKVYRAELVGHKCPECSFFISEEETDAALKLFQPYGTKALKVFTDWSKKRRKELEV